MFKHLKQDRFARACLIAAVGFVPLAANAELISYRHTGALDLPLPTDVGRDRGQPRLGDGTYDMAFTFDRSAMSDGVVTFDEIVALDGTTYLNEVAPPTRRSRGDSGVGRDSPTGGTDSPGAVYQRYTIDSLPVTQADRDRFAIGFDGTQPGASVRSGVDGPSYVLTASDAAGVTVFGAAPGLGTAESTMPFSSQSALSRVGDAGTWSQVPVPEPGSMALLTLGGMMLLRRRRA